MRELCEIKGEDCEILTHCITVEYEGRIINSCGTCAYPYEELHDQPIIVITAQGDPVCSN